MYVHQGAAPDGNSAALHCRRRAWSLGVPMEELLKYLYEYEKAN